MQVVPQRRQLQIQVNLLHARHAGGATAQAAADPGQPRCMHAMQVVPQRRRLQIQVNLLHARHAGGDTAQAAADPGQPAACIPCRWCHSAGGCRSRSTCCMHTMQVVTQRRRLQIQVNPAACTPCRWCHSASGCRSRSTCCMHTMQVVTQRRRLQIQVNLLQPHAEGVEALRAQLAQLEVRACNVGQPALQMDMPCRPAPTGWWVCSC